MAADLAAADPALAMTTGSPELATLILALGGAVAGRLFLGNLILGRIVRRPGDTGPRD